MKNKEIEELLNNIKDKYSYDPYDTTGKVYTTISYEEGQLLLSYIEQLEKENKILRENAEHNDKVVDKVNWEINILKNNRDKAIEEIKYLISNCDIGDYQGEKIMNILKGDSK